MTPVHFGPAIRMVLIFSFPVETRALGISSRNGRKLWALGPIRSSRACMPHMRLPRELYRTDIQVFWRETQIPCVRGNDAEISSESVSIVDLTFGQVASLWSTASRSFVARRDGVYQFPQSISEHLSRNLTNRFQRRSMRDLRRGRIAFALRTYAVNFRKRDRNFSPSCLSSWY